MSLPAIVVAKGGRVIGCCSRSRKGDTQTRAQGAVFMHVCRRGQSYLKGDWCHEKRRRSGDGARPSKVLNLSTKVPFHLQPDDCGSSM